jgi:hypothetical protein
MTQREQKIQVLEESLTETNRFTKAALAAIKNLTSNEFYSSSKEVATVKRASMDLSRALTKVRRG